MKDIEIGPIRPPSESNSLLIRVTRGCHWNKCYFCGLYKSMQFSMRPIDETIEDIRQQAQFYQGKKINSCFLQDGDALVLKTDYLLRILDAINQYFPDIQYITSYARADSITRKTPAELKILRQAGLNHLYCGMETGSAQILRLINNDYYFEYLDFLLRIRPLIDAYTIHSTGITLSRLRLYPDSFLSLYFIVPPITEQKEIADYLDTKCAEIDRLIAKKEQLVKELESYKKSLIYEVVTGKREV